MILHLESLVNEYMTMVVLSYAFDKTLNDRVHSYLLSNHIPFAAFSELELNNTNIIGFIADNMFCDKIDKLLRDHNRAYNEDFLKESRSISSDIEFAIVISRMRLA
jgi:hypothetical protein